MTPSKAPAGQAKSATLAQNFVLCTEPQRWSCLVNIHRACAGILHSAHAGNKLRSRCSSINVKQRHATMGPAGQGSFVSRKVRPVCFAHTIYSWCMAAGLCDTA